MTSNFDPTSFLDQSVTGSNATAFIPHPAGDFPAIITKVTPRQMDSKQNPGTMQTLVDVTYETDDANAREVTGLPKPTVRQSIFLDLNDAGKLDMSKGRNVQLGRLREALGLNDPDKPFSFNSLIGQPCVVKVVHNPSKDGRETYANVDSVGKIV